MVKIEYGNKFSLLDILVFLMIIFLMIISQASPLTRVKRARMYFALDGWLTTVYKKTVMKGGIGVYENEKNENKKNEKNMAY
jgi:hypothetical protein